MVAVIALAVSGVSLAIGVIAYVASITACELFTKPYVDRHHGELLDPRDIADDGWTREIGWQ